MFYYFLYCTFLSGFYLTFVVLFRIGKISQKIQKLKVEKIFTNRKNLKTSVIIIDLELIIIEAVMRIMVKKTTSENITKLIEVIKIESVMIIIVTGMNITEVEIISTEDVEVEVDLLSSLIVT